jgi:hypothetical protein
MTDRTVLELLLGDVLRLRKPHPCGGSDWVVDRLGADIGITCTSCGRRLLLERRQLEERFTAFVTRGDPAATSARPRGRTEPTDG